jgi:chromosome segregation ATPase
METTSVWEIALALIAIGGALIAPTVWFYRTSLAKIEVQNERLGEKVSTEIRDLRSHFDNKLSSVYLMVEERQKEMRVFVSTEMNEVKTNISNIDKKIDDTRERSHELEKDLLRLKHQIGKDYITKSDLERIVSVRT